MAQGMSGAMLALAGCSQPAGSQPAPGETDDALLARLVATSARPHLARRVAPYRLTQPVQLAAGTTLTLEPGTRIIWNGSHGDLYNIVGVFESVGDRVAIVVEGGEAIVSCVKPAPYVYAARMRGRDGFSVTGLRGENVQHVHIAATTEAFPNIHTAGSRVNVARNVQITGGGARHGTPQSEGHGACMLSYVVGATVRGATYENVANGVEWWGGDSNPVRPPAQGVFGNERKCRNLTITDVTVRDAAAGGIWGSMGRDVVVRDCRVDTAHDVAFDAEGSNNVLFERCTARNGHNGCFATFFLCDGVHFVDCRGTVTDKAFPLVRTYNSTLSNIENRGVVVKGGTFECLDHTGPSTIDSAMGPVQDLTITGATLRNVRIDTAYHNMHRTIIAGNTLEFPYPLPSVAAIRAGASKTLSTPNGVVAGSTLIENNRIRLQAGAQPGTKPIAIQLREDDFNGSATGIIRRNTVSGAFATGIALSNATANIGILPIFEINANQFDGMPTSARTLSVTHEGSQARRPTVRWSPNQTRNSRTIIPAEVLR